jgi:hypothetical protein
MRADSAREDQQRVSDELRQSACSGSSSARNDDRVSVERNNRAGRDCRRQRSVVAPSGRDARAEQLTREPPARFHKQNIIRPRREQSPFVTPEVEVADGLLIAARVGPRDVQRRAWAILPPEDRIAAQ